MTEENTGSCLAGLLPTLKRGVSRTKYNLFNPYTKTIEDIKASRPKVLIGTYVHEYKDYSFNRWLKRAVQMALDFKKYGNAQILIVDNSENKEYAKLLDARCDWYRHFKNVECTVVRLSSIPKTTREKQKASQNVLWDATLGGYKSLGTFQFLYIVESDVLPPEDSIVELMKFNKSIVSGIYSLRNEETIEGHKEFLKKEGLEKEWKDKDIGDWLCVIPYFARLINGKMQRFLLHRIDLNKIVDRVEEKQYGHCMRVFACGLGCILIKANVLKVVKPEATSKKQVTFYKRLYKFAVQLEKDIGYKDQYLLPHIKTIRNEYKNILKQKIHPDTNFHILCEKRGIHRYISPYVQCRHLRSNWRDVKNR